MSAGPVVIYDSRWLHDVLQYYELMPIRCHVRDCKAMLIMRHVQSARASVQTSPTDLYLQPTVLRVQ